MPEGSRGALVILVTDTSKLSPGAATTYVLPPAVTSGSRRPLAPVTHSSKPARTTILCRRYPDGVERGVWSEGCLAKVPKQDGQKLRACRQLMAVELGPGRLMLTITSRKASCSTLALGRRRQSLLTLLRALSSSNGRVLFNQSINYI